MGFSESHFMKFFKQHLHTTFTSYLNGYRLTIAARLLLTEDDSILSISERTGFNNLSYLTVYSKRISDVTERIPEPLVNKKRTASEIFPSQVLFFFIFIR